ncbi:hypothetical protein RZQ58_28730, partial [Raoultella planticola]|uniref:hypothetical protein n=1 Tax=Raoultella planticola TaxID=575 RepID=UPI00292C85B1
EWVHVQLHQQKGMISLSPPTICNSAIKSAYYAASISGIFSKQPCCSLEIRLSQKPDLRGGKRAKDMIIKPKT